MATNLSERASEQLVMSLVTLFTNRPVVVRDAVDIVEVVYCEWHPVQSL